MQTLTNKFCCVFCNLKHNNKNINLIEYWANGGTGRRVGLKIQW